MCIASTEHRIIYSGKLMRKLLLGRCVLGALAFPIQVREERKRVEEA